MKRNYLLTLLCLLAAVLMPNIAWGQTYNNGTWYAAYWNSSANSVSMIGSAGEITAIDVYAPAELLSFDYKKYSRASTKSPISVQQSSDGGTNYSEVNGANVEASSTSWSTKNGITINENINKLRFYRTSGTGASVRNVYVTLKKHILLNDGSTYGTKSVTGTMAATAVGNTSEAYTIQLRSFLANDDIQYSSSNSEFHFGDGQTTKTLGVGANYCASSNGTGACSSSSLGQISNYNVNVYFTPSTNDKQIHTTIITISDGKSTAMVELSARVIPTYYFKAEVFTSPAEGGSASVSFSNGNTTYSEVASSADASSLTTQVSYAATPNTEAGYVFAGWVKSLSDKEIYTVEKTFTENLTSDALQEPETAQVSYYAVFTQKYYPNITGNNTSLNVGKNAVASFVFENCSATIPSADTNADFYYTIEQTPDATTKEGSEDATQVVSYDPATNTLTGRNSGTAVITFTQKESANYYAASQSYNITVNKNTGTLTNNLGTAYKVDDAVNIVDCYTASNSEVEVLVESSNTDVIAVVEGQLKAVGVGTATVTFKQAETYKWTELTASQEITVTKYDLSASISQSAATWDATINNPFAISYDLNDYTVEALDPAIATYTDGAIQTYAETGTARFVISRAEDYKYNQLAETLSINVAPKTESDIIYQDNKQYDINYGNSHTYTVSNVLPGDVLTVDFWESSGAQGGLAIYGYVNEAETEIMPNTEFSTTAKTYTFALAKAYTSIKIQGDGGGLSIVNKHCKNFTIRRNLHISADNSNVNMESTISTNATATISLDYGSLGSIFKVVSNNPKITVSPASFNVEGSGTQEITLTGDATVLGTETATITIYDQSKKTTINVTSTINRIPQTISWQSSFENLDVFSTVRLNATASGATEVVYSIAEGEQGKASIAGNVLSFKEAGTVHVVATAAQSEIYEGVSDTVSVEVRLAQPVVSVLPTVEAVTYGTALTNAMLQGGVAKYGETTVEGSFAWADERITEGLTPNTYSFNVRFTPADATHYSTADCTVDVTVNKAQQTIAWQSSFESLNVFSTVTLDATASGATEVVYSIAEGEQEKASIAGNVLSFNEAGIVHVVATAAQSDIYESVSDTVSVEVRLAQPVVSVLPTVEAVAYGTALTNAMLQGGVAKYGETTVEGSFAWADEQITEGLTPNTYSFNVRFTPADATHYSTAVCSVGVTVNKAQQTISWQSSFESLNVFSTVRLDATASGATEVVYSIAEGEQEKASIADNVLSFNEAGIVHVVATAAQSDIYEGVSDTVSVEVRLAQPVVSVLPTVEAVAYGTALTNAMLQGGVAKYGETTVEGSFAWADERITEGLMPNTYSFNVRFTPADATHYSTAVCAVGVTVNKAQQTITWQSSFEKLNVQSEVILSATAQNAVRFAVSDTAVATITGDRLRLLKAGTIDVVAIAEGSDLYEEVADTIKGIVIARIDPVVSQWPSATLTYGKTLTDVVLAGEAVEKGVFQWGDTITDGDLVAVQIAGEYTYAVKFVPADGEQFNTLYGKATIRIVEATQTISWENAPTACKVGERIALKAVASSGLAVEYSVDQMDNYAMIDAERNELVALAKGAIQLHVRQAGEAGKYAAAEDLVLTISIEAGNTTATEQVSADEQVMVRKVLRDGVLYILRGGMCYDINGRLIGAE